MVGFADYLPWISLLVLAFGAGIAYLRHEHLIKAHQAGFSTYVEAFQSLIAALGKSGAIKNDDVIGILTKLSKDSISRTLEAIAGGTGNPITIEEAQKLQQYRNMATHSLSFTPQQAQEFYNLSQRVVQDRSQDKGAWDLFWLAVFVFALYLLAKSDTERG